MGNDRMSRILSINLTMHHLGLEENCILQDKLHKYGTVKLQHNELDCKQRNFGIVDRFKIDRIGEMLVIFIAWKIYVYRYFVRWIVAILLLSDYNTKEYWMVIEVFCIIIYMLCWFITIKHAFYYFFKNIDWSKCILPGSKW